MSKTIATKWYSQALHDMNIAEKNIAVGGYDTSAFLCQQAVEKLLKAVVASMGPPAKDPTSMSSSFPDPSRKYLSFAEWPR